MKSLPCSPNHFPAYYDHRRGIYLLDAEHGWTCFAKEDLKQHMRRAGWPTSKDGMSQLDYELMRIQDENKIDYAGPVAGHPRGIRTMQGSRILVTQSFQLLTPRPGSWDIFRTCIENLFDRVHPLQKPVFYSWCKVYLESLIADLFMPGQAFILVGPRNCGKSFLQNLLTILFGGRSANPYPYMSGETDFNSGLFGAEHMLMEDPPVNSIIDRLDFAARIKQFTVCETQPCHGKNRDIVTIEPRWRVTGSINDEPYNMRAIPPVDNSTADKLSICKCAADSIPCTSNDVRERERFRQQVISELPAFMHFLLYEWRIPDNLKSGRFGVTHFHHPEILAEINDNSPEFDLLRIFDENNIFNASGCWTGTLKQLVSKLLEYPGDPECIRIAHHERTLAIRMKSLAMKCPLRVQFRKSDKSRIYLIYRSEPGKG